MKISFLCSDLEHPINSYLCKWIEKNTTNHIIELVRKKTELSGGDILFLISCSEIVNKKDRSFYDKSLVLHASDLPEGRGWSPHIWQLIEGSNEITLTLLEAEDKVDSGDIWKKVKFEIPNHLLWDEINHELFEKEIELIDFAVQNFGLIIATPQNLNIEPSYYPKRTSSDSQIDISKSIASQFNKMRVCDPNRFPAYLEIHGKKFKLTLEKVDNE